MEVIDISELCALRQNIAALCTTPERFEQIQNEIARLLVVIKEQLYAINENGEEILKVEI